MGDSFSRLPVGSLSPGSGYLDREQGRVLLGAEGVPLADAPLAAAPDAGELERQGRFEEAAVGDVCVVDAIQLGHLLSREDAAVANVRVQVRLGEHDVIGDFEGAGVLASD